MEDRGARVAYRALEKGDPVDDVAGQRIGTIEEFVGDEGADPARPSQAWT
jgi:hypothetical protein